MATFGHRGALAAEVAADLEQAARDDPDARVRAAALGALVRAGEGPRPRAAWDHAVGDPDAAVRRRAADLARSLPETAPGLITLLADADVTVVVAAAESLGELGPDAVKAGAVSALAGTTTDHPDALAREAAVAALGALADPAGLRAVLTACNDKPAVRRRAVLALAPFEGPEVDAALKHALEDNDWQVRQAAEDLTTPPR